QAPPRLQPQNPRTRSIASASFCASGTSHFASPLTSDHRCFNNHEAHEDHKATPQSSLWALCALWFASSEAEPCAQPCNARRDDAGDVAERRTRLKVRIRRRRGVEHVE